MVARFAGLLFCLSLVPAAAVAAPPETVDYVCRGGKTISATYLSHREVGFVVLRWNGRDHGLAEAPSASGARYASMAGTTPEQPGLEWWEHKGEATLSAFTGKDFFDTKPLLTECRPRK
ncbi:MliC family protein [Azospirillum sp.]|uniref:MliC family protein n=1 Tax=Azospirillum sp. TaxID=34012 RepID=UPI002D30C9DE|nr:MliC family protein [Azospirillum sp.]HYD64821.1 MliC family protein [Azospirillum sp.]